ncbi:ASCH domain-containing protein, partial [Escherichia coli]
MTSASVAVKTIRGEKTEEYRLCNDYWNKRLVNRKYYRLIITKGYP